jgi:hypothetical protein
MSQTQEHTDINQGDQSDDRVARFRADVADMHLRDPRAGRERLWLFIGGLLMVLGVGLAIGGYFQSSGASSAYNTEGPATQRDAITIALIGVSVSVVGAAIFLRYSLAQFFRFWLARLIYEQQAATDRIVESQSG